MNFILQNQKALIIAVAIILGFALYAAFPRYYAHTAYHETVIVDRWTGKVIQDSGGGGYGRRLR